jgi:ABC-type bacteriocin/lantibiotic exporter with double-glycine peptidase domain
MEAAECGAVSLKVLLEYYGSHVDLNRVKILVGIGRDGSSARQIGKAASILGLTLLPLKVDIEEVKTTLQPPYICFWQSKHWLVVEGYENGYLYVSDPAKGRVRYPEKDASSYFSGLVLVPASFDKNKSEFSKTDVNHNLIDLFVAFKSPVLLTLLLSLCSLIPELAFSLSLGAFTQSIASNQISNGIISQAWFMGLLSGLCFLFLYLRFLLLRKVSQSAFLRLSKTVVYRLLTAPYLFYSLRSTGELGSRVARIESISSQLTQSLLPGVFSFFRACLAILILLIINQMLGVFVLVLFIIISYVVISLSSASIRDSAVNDRYSGKSLGILIDIIRSSELVKATGSELSFFQNWAGNFSQYITASQSVSLNQAIISTITQVGNYLLGIGILFLAAFEVMNGRTDISVYISFVYFSAIVSESLSLLPALVAGYSSISGYKWRLNDILDQGIDSFSQLSALSNRVEYTNDAAEAVDANAIVRPCPDRLTRDAVKVSNLSFIYPGAQSFLFSDLSFTISSGQFVSFEGDSGCGKSTLVKMIAGLLLPSSGEIEIFGRNRDSLNQYELHNIIGYVPQDPFLFAGSLLDNITLNDPGVSFDSVESAVDITDLMTRLEATDLASYHIYEHGSNLSGGQKQLVEFARALARNPKILVLDEATAGFDNSLERLVLERLKSQDLTILSIAHRKTALDLSDCILDMTKLMSTSRSLAPSQAT